MTLEVIIIIIVFVIVLFVHKNTKIRMNIQTKRPVTESEYLQQPQVIMQYRERTRDRT